MRRTKKSITKGLGGPYIHIDRDLSPLVLQEMGAYLKNEITALVSKEISVHVEIAEGSIKIYVFFGASALFQIVSGYGSFKSGIDHIVSDVQSLSEIVFDSFFGHEGVTEDEIIYKARRLGVPGKIQRFLKKLDRIDDQDVNAEERIAFVDELKDELLDILTLLENQKDRELIIDQTPKVIRDQLPKNLPNPIEGALDLRYEQPEDYPKPKIENYSLGESGDPSPIPEPKTLERYFIPPPKREGDDF